MRRNSYKSVCSNNSVRMVTRRNSPFQYVKNHTSVKTYDNECQLIKDIDRRGPICRTCGSKSCNERTFKKTKGENKQRIRNFNDAMTSF